MRQSETVVDGWAELLFRHTDDDPHNLSDIHDSDYTMASGTLPLGEYISAFDIYEQFKDNIPMGCHRILGPFDLINICSRSPKVVTKSLLVCPRDRYAAFSYTGSRAQTLPDRPEVLVPLQTALRSFKLNRHWPGDR